MNKRIVAVTPAGRKSYLEVLAPYIFAKRGVIDEWHLWINTAKEQDVSYCRYLHAERYKQVPRFFSWVRLP